MQPTGWFVRWVLPPTILIAAAVVAWWTYVSAFNPEALRQRSVVESTSLLTREKVDRVEQLIIQGDNAAEHLVDPDDLEALGRRWGRGPNRVAPTVRSVLVLDQNQRLLRHFSRVAEEEATAFRRLFLRSMLPALELAGDAPGAHRHLHENFEGRSVLLSALCREVEGRRYFVVLEIDLDYLQNYVFRELFDDPDARARFNILSEDGRRIFGRNLGGGIVVSRTFPTTLYKWRLSVEAPEGAELQAAQRRQRRLNGLLVGLSLGVLIAGVFLLAFTTRNEQRLNELKSDFIATVSHELKTPLSLIRMFGEMLATGRVPSEDRRREYLDIIVRESERLTGLIDNVLDFAKVERGKAAYEFSPGNLGEVVTRAIELFRWRLGERPALRVEVAPDVPDTELDERALQLLLFNLLDNARKYAGQGEWIAVRVSFERGRLVLEVEDCGQGIDEDDARRVFDRFYRGKSAQGGSARGSGIGLALVKHIAQAHGGDVSVHRGSQGGALLRVTLPLRRVSLA